MKVVFTDNAELYTSNHDIERQYLPKDAVVDVAVYNAKGDNTEFYEKIADADIIINVYVYFGKKELDALKKCKVISFESTGYNEVDLEYAAQKGIAVVSILDYCTQETAENAFALMLCLQRGTLLYNRSVQVDHQWNVHAVQHLKRIEGQTMGIVGLGRIGQSVAKKANGFGMNVIAYDPYLPPEIAQRLGVELVDIDTLLEQSDVVSVHMNLTDENAYFFDKEKFLKMKKKPIFINEGRGTMVSEEVLAWALDEGLIRGAGIDMLENEAPTADYIANCKLLGRDNVIINPHSGYASDTSRELIFKLPIENALLVYEGKYKECQIIRNGVGLD